MWSIQGFLWTIWPWTWLQVFGIQPKQVLMRKHVNQNCRTKDWMKKRIGFVLFCGCVFPFFLSLFALSRRESSIYWLRNWEIFASKNAIQRHEMENAMDKISSAKRFFSIQFVQVVEQIHFTESLRRTNLQRTVICVRIYATGAATSLVTVVTSKCCLGETNEKN